MKADHIPSQVPFLPGNSFNDPYKQKFNKQHVFDKTKEFIHSAPVSYPILAGDMDAMTLAETLGDNQSILPYTVIIDSKGAIVKTFFGRINQQILEETLTPLLGVLPTK